MKQIKIIRKNVLLSIIISLVNFCYMHHANVSGDLYGAKNIIPFPNSQTFNALPVRVEFNNREKDEMFNYLHKKGVNIRVEQELVDSYYSDEILAQFRSSRYFALHPNSNMKVRIFSTIEEVKDPVVTIIPFVLTLGLFPTLTRSNGTIEFEVFDSKNHSILKSYKYPVEHRYFFGVSSIFLAPILGLFSERFDHSQNARTFAITRVVFRQFEEDIIKDVFSRKDMADKFFVNKTKTVAFLPFQASNERETEVFSEIYSSLESAFIDRGILLVERRKLNSILNEVRLSQDGITNSSTLKIGQLSSADRIIINSDLYVSYVSFTRNRIERLSFSIRCIEIETGKILWSENIDQRVENHLDLKKSINALTDTLISNLRRKGNI